jgi:hypothetical protein
VGDAEVEAPDSDGDCVAAPDGLADVEGEPVGDSVADDDGLALVVGVRLA